MLTFFLQFVKKKSKNNSEEERNVDTDLFSKVEDYTLESKSITSSNFKTKCGNEGVQIAIKTKMGT